ncbi:site-specific integrase [uncultured Alteromonas sp.]|uniref:site-specific integrase n=1 Tax=uncultured Alteromonas sp. TaxID=179113 RepID=UPI0030CA8CD8
MGIESEIKNVSRHISMNGYEFDIFSERWVLDRNRTITLGFLTSLPTEVAFSIRMTLCFFAETSSSHHTVNLQIAIENYFRVTGEISVSESGLLNYKSHYADKSYRVGVLRVFLKQSHFLKTGLLDNDCLELLEKWRLRGNDKGDAVKSLCPETGPYSDLEYESILHRLNTKYAEGSISEFEYVLVSLFAFSGRRPIQLASLKIKDFYVSHVLLGYPIYVLNIPKSKVRKGKFRSSSTEFGVESELAQIISLHIDRAVREAEMILGRELTESEAEELPFFYNNLEPLKGLEPEEAILLLSSSDICHLTSAEITRALKDTVSKLEIYSERTGRLLVTTAYRFRYTLGTRAARDGCGLIQIATLLDHSDTQNTKCYFANIPEHAKTISHFMNNALLKYATAFEGRLTERPTHSKEKAILTDNGKEEIGSCGTSAFCYDFAPVACYTCKKFKPWADAPHHLVLDWLMKERARILNKTNDAAIAAINDRTIVAVMQVIKLSEEFKEECSES